MEKKIKHLEFLQLVITRMSTNSFIIKGWAVTLISAIFVLADKDSNQNYIIPIFIATSIFWYLNAFFLLQERKYRCLYDEIRIKDEKEIDFTMDTSKYDKDRNTVHSCLFAESIWPIYVSLLFISWLVKFKF